MAYLDKVLLGNPDPVEHEIIVSEDIDAFLLQEGFIQNYQSGVRPRFRRGISDPGKLHCDLIILVYSDMCVCAVNNTATHDFRFDKDDYQNFVSNYLHLIDRLAHNYKK